MDDDLLALVREAQESDFIFKKNKHIFFPPPFWRGYIRSGSIKREEFAYLFCGKLRLLSHEEAEALLGVLDRYVRVPSIFLPPTCLHSCK